jgi:hypothetical protein
MIDSSRSIQIGGLAISLVLRAALMIRMEPARHQKLVSLRPAIE